MKFANEIRGNGSRTNFNGNEGFVLDANPNPHLTLIAVPYLRSMFVQNCN